MESNKDRVWKNIFMLYFYPSSSNHKLNSSIWFQRGVRHFQHVRSKMSNNMINRLDIWIVAHELGFQRCSIRACILLIKGVIVIECILTSGWLSRTFIDFTFNICSSRLVSLATSSFKCLYLFLMFSLLTISFLIVY